MPTRTQRLLRPTSRSPTCSSRRRTRCSLARHGLSKNLIANCLAGYLAVRGQLMNGRPGGEGEREFSQVACSSLPASWRICTALFVTRLSAKLHTNCCLITAPDLPTDRCPLLWRHFLRTGTPITNLPCSERHLTAHRAPSTLHHSLSIPLERFFCTFRDRAWKFGFSRTPL